MDFFNVLSLFCGLAFFLFGMQTMSHNLERLAGGKLEGTLPHRRGRCGADDRDLGAPRAEE